MDEKILQLLETTDYSALTAEELTLVKQHLSKEEYGNMRLNVLAMKEVFDAEIESQLPDEEMLLALNKSMVKKDTVIRKLITMKVSFLKVAAVFVLVFISYSLVMYNLLKEPAQGDIEYMAEAEAFYKTRSAEHIDTDDIVKNKVIKNHPHGQEEASEEALLDKPVSESDRRSLRETYGNQIIAQAYNSSKKKHKGLSKKHEGGFLVFVEPRYDYM